MARSQDMRESEGCAQTAHTHAHDQNKDAWHRKKQISRDSNMEKTLASLLLYYVCAQKVGG